MVPLMEQKIRFTTETQSSQRNALKKQYVIMLFSVTSVPLW